jgi:hypothetical protein
MKSTFSRHHSEMEGNPMSLRIASNVRKEARRFTAVIIVIGMFICALAAGQAYAGAPVQKTFNSPMLSVP